MIYWLKYVFIVIVYLALPWYIEVPILIGDFLLTGLGLDEIIMIIGLIWKFCNRDLLKEIKNNQ